MKQFCAKPSLLLAMVFLLTGCGMFGNKVDNIEVAFFRDVDVELASTTRFDAENFAGFWNIRSEFQREGDQHLRAGVEFVAGPNSQIAQIVLHGPKRRGRFGAISTFDVDQTAPGRMVYGAAPYTTEYWVLWVDADYRTAVIGTPSGSFGWIIDRDRRGGDDRIKAARDVLEWMGYDLNALVNLP